MSIPRRSHSAPQVGASTSYASRATSTSEHRAQAGGLPELHRHHSVAVLTDISTSYPRSLYKSPRGERAEDPFSLAGFFPKQAETWSWLHFDDEDGAEDEDEDEDWSRSAVADSSSKTENEKGIPSTPELALVETDSDVDEETIKQEDRLGILSLEKWLAFSGGDHPAHDAYGPLLSPYSEDSSADSEALYAALCALRQAHTLQPVRIADASVVRHGGLFSPVDEADGSVDEKNVSWETLVPQGIWRVMSMLSL